MFTIRNIAALAACLSVFSVLAKDEDPWRIVAVNPLDTPYYGETVANGIVGLRSSQSPFVNDGVLLADTYDRHAKEGIDTYFENIRFLDFSMAVDGKQLGVSDLSAYTQTLDMRSACMISDFTVPGDAAVRVRQYALRQLPYNALTQVVVTPLRDISLSVTSCPSVPANLADVRWHYRKMTKKRGNVYLLSAEARGLKPGLEIASAASFVFDNGAYPEVTYDSVAHTASFSVVLHKGREYCFGLIGSLISSKQTHNVRNEADRLTILAAMTGRKALVDGHLAEWNKLWENDILVSGSPADQRDIHSMLYHMYSNLRADSHLSIPPMGVTGLSYYGHIFWDADMWMMPVLLLLHPELAKSMIDFRIDLLDSACVNAFEHGYRGAMFPWESSDSGLEETPTWALTGIFEHHITGCVALAAWQYYCVTGDVNWLRTRAFPLIKGAADFWVSRTDTDPDGSRHIRNVCCADEYASKVDDNAFTNAVAMETARVAVKAAGIVGQPVGDGWQDLIGALPISKMDNGVIREYAGYDGEKIKQADVNLLAYPLGVVTDRDQILRDLKYYAAKVPVKNTPAMTESIFALLYSRIGDAGNAADYFHRSYRQNMLPPFGVLAECKGGKNPYFLTGAGGVLQAVIMGFAGYDITDEGVRKLASATPQGWSGLEVKLNRNVRVVSAVPYVADCASTGN